VRPVAECTADARRPTAETHPRFGACTRFPPASRRKPTSGPRRPRRVRSPASGNRVQALNLPHESAIASKRQRSRDWRSRHRHGRQGRRRAASSGSGLAARWQRPRRAVAAASSRGGSGLAARWQRPRRAVAAASPRWQRPRRAVAAASPRGSGLVARRQHLARRRHQRQCQNSLTSSAITSPAGDHAILVPTPEYSLDTVGPSIYIYTLWGRLVVYCPDSKGFFGWRRGVGQGLGRGLEVVAATAGRPRNVPAGEKVPPATFIARWRALCP